MVDPNFKIKTLEIKDNYGMFSIEPLAKGFGNTLGNALRRVMLTSLEGNAVSSVRIEGVKHQFSTVSGLKEDMVEFILNLKQLRFMMTNSSGVCELNMEGPAKITGRDLKCEGGLEVVNGDLYLGELADKKSKLTAQLTIEKGYGFVPSEEKKKEALGVILVDSLYSPVRKANYKIESTRVGRITDLDRLIIEVTTDGSLAPYDALKQAAKILVSYFMQIYEPKAETSQTDVAVTPAVSDEILKMELEELDLPMRIFNALDKAGITTVGQLLGTPIKELMEIKNFGAKSISVVEEKLREKGVALGV